MQGQAQLEERLSNIMIDIVCVLWGVKFPEEYAYNLKSMVERNTTLPHRFVCFSDRQLNGIETKILKPGHHGWWNKIQIFNTEFGLNKRIVFFDLDTLIVSNIDWLLQYKGDFMGIEDVGARHKDGSVWRRKLVKQMQSAVMSFDRDACSYVWDNFAKDPQNLARRWRGDGNYINHVVKNRDMIQYIHPGKLWSYKYHVYPNKPDNDTSIVCFHGRPSIIESTQTTVRATGINVEPRTWVNEYWKAK